MGLAAILVPKCPLCLAAHLSLLGLGMSVAGFTAQLLPWLLAPGALCALVLWWSIR